MGAGEILLSALAAACVVVSGALYALFFALGRLYVSAKLTAVAWICYALLVAFTFVLAGALDLGGAWIWVIAVMLVGYLVLPKAIWHLSVGTHAGETQSLVTRSNHG